MRFNYIYLVALLFASCTQKSNAPTIEDSSTLDRLPEITQPSIIVLGTVQDAGSPQIACRKKCCTHLFKNPEPNRMVVSLGIVNPIDKTKYLFEASPDIGRQIELLNSFSSNTESIPTSIFLTHAHIGHYTGLMYLGKEALNAKSTPVFAMPQMSSFLENNGPWDNLVKDKNIALNVLTKESRHTLDQSLKVIPFTVPHRDEYSETVGYKIIGPNKKALFIPDIDKWDVWEKDIIEEIKLVDYALIDATFYDGNEINNRDISEIPHPFVIESMKLFDSLTKKEKNKIYFIHLNHTNPLLNKKSKEYKTVTEAGYHTAEVFDILTL